MGRFSVEDTIRNFFLHFPHAHMEAFWRPFSVGSRACYPVSGGFSLKLGLRRVLLRRRLAGGGSQGIPPAQGAQFGIGVR